MDLEGAAKVDPHLIKYINEQLKASYGIDTITGLVMWRVVWAPDQREKRFGTFEDFTPAGIFLREVTEVREVPKYEYLGEKWILENLTVVPYTNAEDLPDSKLSYEPMFPFESNNGSPLPPHLGLAKLVIESVHAVKGKSQIKQYKHPDADREQALVDEEKRIQHIYEALYGEETPVGDALRYGSGVTVPHTYERQH